MNSWSDSWGGRCQGECVGEGLGRKSVHAPDLPNCRMPCLWVLRYLDCFIISHEQPPETCNCISNSVTHPNEQFVLPSACAPFPAAPGAPSQWSPTPQTPSLSTPALALSPCSEIPPANLPTLCTQGLPAPSPLGCPGPAGLVPGKPRIPDCAEQDRSRAGPGFRTGRVLTFLAVLLC